jgi:glycosyltransferase involved in cell wall biosynthesis
MANPGKKILVSIVPYKVFPAKLGGQKGIALFNEYLACEAELVCITVKSNLPGFAKGYRLLNILSDKAFRYINPLYFFVVRKKIREYGATHLILEHPYYGWLGILLKWFTGVKLVIHSHNIEATRWKSLGKWWWRILWWYERATHRSASCNFFIQDEDRSYAIRQFNLDARKCTTITYGIEWDGPPDHGEKKRCRELLVKENVLSGNETIFLFNGTLDYKPNLDAIRIILEQLNPILLKSGLLYKIIICGRGLPAFMEELKAYTNQNIIYSGFVDDITVYFKGADVFINPVIDGGGIKTKLVEALGYNTKSISTLNGSLGVSPEETGGQLVIVPNHDWEGFAREMIKSPDGQTKQTSEQFYQKFYWGNIAKKAAAFIRK